tara:strand:- start:12498 stop:13097 length:600 start_codon:yes stop_codon:yes gene_type:complete
MESVGLASFSTFNLRSMKIAPPLAKLAPLAAFAVLQALLIAALAETLGPSEGSQSTTKIVAEHSNFDSGENLVLFETDVVFSNASMTMKCDTLEVELNPDRNEGVGAAGSIKTANASGFVVIETENQEGDPVIATARNAIYDTARDMVVLSNFPKIQDNGQEVIGTSLDTRIFLSKDGKYRVEGPNRTTILQKNFNAPF